RDRAVARGGARPLRGPARRPRALADGGDHGARADRRAGDRQRTAGGVRLARLLRLPRARRRRGRRRRALAAARDAAQARARGGLRPGREHRPRPPPPPPPPLSPPHPPPPPPPLL